MYIVFFFDFAEYSAVHLAETVVLAAGEPKPCQLEWSKGLGYLILFSLVLWRAIRDVRDSRELV